MPLTKGPGLFMIRASCALVVMLFSGVASAQTQQFVARHSGRCLTVLEGRGGGGPNPMMNAIMRTVVQMGCENGNAKQEWRTISVMGSRMRLQSVSAGQCLTVPDGSFADNAPLIISPCGEGQNAEGQHWEFRPNGRGNEIVSARSHKCIDIENGGMNDNARVVQLDCGRGEHEIFEMRPVGQVMQQMAQPMPMPPVANPPPMMNGPSIAGTWRWSNNTTVEFWDNGNARSSNGQTARWVREDGRRIAITWNEGWVDRVMLSDNGQELRGSNQNGGQVAGDRMGAPGYTPPPVQPVNNMPIERAGDMSNCGAGPDDPGCGMNRNGNRPLDAREFTSTVEDLRRRPDDNERRTLMNNLFNTRVITARQFGVLIDMFPIEPIKLEVARERARSVLDPDHLGVFVGRFRDPPRRTEFENIVANAQRDARGGAGVNPVLRNEVIRR